VARGRDGEGSPDKLAALRERSHAARGHELHGRVAEARGLDRSGDYGDAARVGGELAEGRLRAPDAKPESATAVATAGSNKSRAPMSAGGPATRCGSGRASRAARSSCECAQKTARRAVMPDSGVLCIP